jgi:hypothetical protein
MPGVEHGDHCLPCSARQLHQTKHAALVRAACFVQKVTGTSRANWCRSMRSTVLHEDSTGVTNTPSERGLLLEAYAFWQMGQIALYASIACFALAVVMLIFTIFGFVHMRRTPEDAEI